MPAHRLANSQTNLPALAVVGTYSNEGKQYVGHVAIAMQAGVISYGDDVEVYEMGPPLSLGDPANASRIPLKRKIHVLGWLELSPDDYAGILDWIADLRGRFAGRTLPLRQYTHDELEDSQYIFSPPIRKIVRDGPTGRQIYEHFSCVGFVLACYEEGAGYSLITNPDTTAPSVGLRAIEKIMGRPIARIVKRNVELFGNPPWPVVFGGYVFHALANANLPHSPKIIEVKFDLRQNGED